MKTTLAIAALISMLAIPATASPGQDRPGMMGDRMKMHGGMMMDRGMMHCPMMGMMMGKKPRTEGHLAFLKAELKITAKQESAWKAYADTMRGIHGAMTKKGDKKGGGMMMQEGKRKPAPEALQARIDMMEGMLANLKKLQAATASLYKVLDDSQKATADELLGMPCGLMSR